jgi:hypothetical protein
MEYYEMHKLSERPEKKIKKIALTELDKKTFESMSVGRINRKNKALRILEET